jgi:hypothetical protein
MNQQLNRVMTMMTDLSTGFRKADASERKDSGACRFLVSGIRRILDSETGLFCRRRPAGFAGLVRALLKWFSMQKSFCSSLEINPHRKLKGSFSIVNPIRAGLAVCFISCLMCPIDRAVAADALPLINRIDWTKAGVEGGIPHRTTIYQTLSPGASSSQIQSAINSCPANQVVFLSAGTYNLSGAIKVNRDNVTIRGATNSAGEPTTILNFSSSASGWGLFDFSKIGYLADNNWPVTTRDVTSTLSKGATTATLSSTPTGLQVGQILVFDQTEDGVKVNVMDSTEGGNWGRGNRYYMQFTKVTAINGSTVTFTPPIYGEYWSASQSPQCYWFGNGTSGFVVGSGVEDLKVNRTANGGGSHNVHFGPAMNCWARNVWSKQAALGHFRFAYSLFCEVRDSVATLHDNYQSATYAFYCVMSGSCKVENNIVYDSPCVIDMASFSGSVVAYNYTTNIHVANLAVVPECIMTHGGHVYANLVEGNFTPSIWLDFIHGSSSHCAWVRNKVTGWEPGRSSQPRPFNMQAHQDYHAALGNVLGTAGVQSSYGEIFWSDNATSYSTLVRKGNFNTVNNGIRAEEALGGDVIAHSYLYTSKPPWFGDRPWPLVDPTAPLTATVMNIPAGYRYLTGELPPMGPPNLPPIVVATALPKTGDAPLSVNFLSTGSLDPELVPLTYSWNFGDGTSSTVANPSHTYSIVGTFNASLTVSDGVRQTTSTNIVINVTGQPPVAPQGLHIMTP